MPAFYDGGTTTTSSTSTIWPDWCTTRTLPTRTLSDTVWRTWYQGTFPTTSATTTADTWFEWQGTETGRVVVREPFSTENVTTWEFWSEAELAQREARRDPQIQRARSGDVNVAVREMQRQNELERQQREARFAAADRKRRNALERSMLLLREACNDDQIQQLEDEGAVVVTGKSGTRYKVTNRGSVANVHVLNERGHTQHRLCAHPLGVPQGDIMLAQKLMIEHNEDAFVRLANRH